MALRSAACVRLTIALLGWMVSPSLVGADPGPQAGSVPVTSMRAAFLFRFAQFTEWPADALPPAAPIAFCAVGDPETADALDRTVRQQSINGHALVVRREVEDGGARACHVLFIGHAAGKAGPELIRSVAGAPVLTVSEEAAFAESGGIVQLYTERARMRFAVNVDTALRQRLRLSSQLLSLARIVKAKDAPLP